MPIISHAVQSVAVFSVSLGSSLGRLLHICWGVYLFAWVAWTPYSVVTSTSRGRINEMHCLPLSAAAAALLGLPKNIVGSFVLHLTTGTLASLQSDTGNHFQDPSSRAWGIKLSLFLLVCWPQHFACNTSLSVWLTDSGMNPFRKIDTSACLSERLKFLQLGPGCVCRWTSPFQSDTSGATSNWLMQVLWLWNSWICAGMVARLW
jgi:hypothetical protein